MASASRAAARISSADALFAMRYCGLSRASAFCAGSSDGNGLSVMAMMGRRISITPSSRRIAGPVPAISTQLAKLCQEHRDARAKPAHDGGGLQSKNLWIDAIRQFSSFQEGKDIVDDDFCHLLAHFRGGAAQMRSEHDIRHGLQTPVDLRLVLEHIKAGAGNLLVRQRA